MKGIQEVTNQNVSLLVFFIHETILFHFTVPSKFLLYPHSVHYDIYAMPKLLYSEECLHIL